MSQVTQAEVNSFLDKMDYDCAEFRKQFDAECKLADSIEEYEKIFGVKLDVNERSR